MDDGDDPFLPYLLRLIDDNVLQVEEVEDLYNLPLALLEFLVVGIPDSLVHLIFELNGGLVLLHYSSRLLLGFPSYHLDHCGPFLDHRGPIIGQLELCL